MTMHTPTLASSARALLVRDARLLWRRRGDAAQPLLFALLVVVLFALAGNAQRDELAKISPQVIWVAALLSGLLALDNLFRGDAEDGTLEQWLLPSNPNVPLAWLVAVRVLGHWLATSLPVIAFAPLLGELLYLPHGLIAPLLVSLLLGTPLLALLGAIVAALVVGMKRSGILLALLALPLYVPVLVFGAGSVAAVAQGLDATGAWLLLGAGLALALVLAPLATAAALRIALD